MDRLLRTMRNTGSDRPSWREMAPTPTSARWSGSSGTRKPRDIGSSARRIAAQDAAKTAGSSMGREAHVRNRQRLKIALSKRLLASLVLPELTVHGYVDQPNAGCGQDVRVVGQGEWAPTPPMPIAPPEDEPKEQTQWSFDL